MMLNNPSISSFVTPVFALAVLFSGVAGTSASADEMEHFVTRSGDQLMVGDKSYRFISVNIPNLLVIEDAFSFAGKNPWRWPDEFEIDDALESVRQMGGQVVRTYVISVYREGSDMGKTVHVFAPGEFNEEGFKTLDKVLEIAHRKGIRLMIPFFDRAPWMGGQPQYAAFHGKKPNDFWTDPEIIADFKKTIEHVINRKNTYTGRLYRDEPAVFGWETGNEIDATQEWTHEIAAYVKQLDPKHLVVDGRSLHGVSPWQVEEPNTDLVTTHHYPHGPGSSDFVPAIREAHALTKGKKPYAIGEFGFTDTPQIKRVYDTAIEDGMAGALLWSLRFHNRDGGFYWHMEVGAGGNFYKAYHWPGFTSGAAYDERAVMQLTRDKGFEIQGQQPPAIQKPAAPKLLPIEHPAMISWQGAVGASGYDVERADKSVGPWVVVGKDVSDADAQYRPLFSDDSAKAKKPYYYRVISRNSAGESAPSNVIGPVSAPQQMLVDECRELKSLHESTGDVTVRTTNARLTKEDGDRFALANGSSITYRLDGPARSWRVYAFAPKDDVELVAAASADGKEFRPIKAERISATSGRGDYGYLAPVMFQGSTPTGSIAYLRFSLPAAGNSADAEAQKAAAGSQPAGAGESAFPLQVSRVEIDFEPAH
jgi:mannan endo-1,4-beta-mannosidase